MNQEEIAVGVIPDEIEPRIGYKYLRVLGSGVMLSPMYHLTWTPFEKVEAEGCETYTWEPHRKPPATTEGVYFEEGDPALGSGVAAPPLLELPPGMSWFLVQGHHQAPNEECSCGIYGVDRPSQCQGYNYGDDFVLVEIAFWGKVVPADYGVRAQYAYPKAIYAQKNNFESAQKAAALYGVPLIAADKKVIAKVGPPFPGVAHPKKRGSDMRLFMAGAWCVAAVVFAAASAISHDMAALAWSGIYILLAIASFFFWLKPHCLRP